MKLFLLGILDFWNTAATVKMGWSPQPLENVRKSKELPSTECLRKSTWQLSRENTAPYCNSTATTRTNEPEWSSVEAVLQEEMKIEIFQKIS